MSSRYFWSAGKLRSASFMILLIILLVFVNRYPITLTSDITLESSMDVYKHAEKLVIDGLHDPLCPWTNKHKIYTCAGYCPWVLKKLVKCDFLARVVHKKFQQHRMYCKPFPDNCLSHDAWLKDILPPTLNPMRVIPVDLVENFTLSGEIPVDYGIGFYFSNYSGIGLNWSVNFVNTYRDQVRHRQPFGTYKTTALYPVLETYSTLAIRNKKCAVVGSEFPWIEAALLEFGAASVTTIEYNGILTDVPNLFTITPMAFADKQKRDAAQGRLEPFDSIWSYSSLEHDGLGRYTDPMNPYGDFQTMTKISCMLKPGGLLFLAVPTNKQDILHFNLHRIYGPLRLPILVRYFHLVQVFGDDFPSDRNDYNWQPVLVLQNKIGCR